MGLGTLWATLQELIPCEVRNAKCLETNAPQAWASMQGTLFGGGPCRGAKQNKCRSTRGPAALFEGNKRTARSFLGCCFTHFWLIFSVAEMRWLEGFTYNNGGLHSILLTIAMVVVRAHTPCRGGGALSSKRHALHCGRDCKLLCSSLQGVGRCIPLCLVLGFATFSAQHCDALREIRPQGTARMGLPGHQVVSSALTQYYRESGY